MAEAEPSPGGFIAVYRWEVEAAHETAFRERWRRLTMLGRELGAFGSCLTREESGHFVAIALWPSEAARTAAFERIGPQDPWNGARRLSEMKLQVEEDLWISSPFDGPRQSGGD